MGNRLVNHIWVSQNELIFRESVCMYFSSMTIFSSFMKWSQSKNFHWRRVAFCWYHLRANDLALPNVVAELRFIEFQSCANLFEAASGYPGIGFRRLSLYLSETWFWNILPNGFISFRAFQIEIAIVSLTACVRLRRPALWSTVSDLTLSFNLVWVIVLAVDHMDLSISVRMPDK